MAQPKNVALLNHHGKQIADITRKRAHRLLSAGKAVILEDDGQEMTVVQLSEVVHPTRWEETLRALISLADDHALMVMLTQTRILLVPIPEYGNPTDEATINVPNTLDGLQGALAWIENSYPGEEPDEDEED